MTRLRDLGIETGILSPGPRNAISDVAGVTVGHTTVIRDDDVIARTGVTVVRPRPGHVRTRPLFAGSATLNGNGEMTGLEWVRESGLLTTDLAITGTHSVGVVRDTLVAIDTAHDTFRNAFSLPVVGETADLSFNSGNAQFVTGEHVRAAYASASADFDEGSVGGGTGMVCHGFKGGIGTASRRLDERAGGWTVGVLVQANHGTRHDFRVDGRPVGRHRRLAQVPLPGRIEPGGEPSMPPGSGSIIVIVATDAPLLPDQCRRLATRTGIGVGRVGGGIQDSSGDIMLAFSTATENVPTEGYAGGYPPLTRHFAVPHQALDDLFRAVVEATEESIVNAMLAAPTMTGARGFTAYGLDPEDLRAAFHDVR
ncbi:P1 family peptidase [Embleya hyalina]|uniref:D-aminopeptidase n=1 Tax=Embleya hyalina TaxID=516124 RepID=A0A401Z1C5_9ACTN|nr:P1 family peptidase [Embleya hyalina]GCE00654.1 D-aminopeptidase [Embleya hyalina]